MVTVTMYVQRENVENSLHNLAVIEVELSEMEAVEEKDPVYFKVKYVSRRVPFHSEHHYIQYPVTVNVPWQVYLMVVKLNEM